MVAFDHIDLHCTGPLLIVDMQFDFLPGGHLAVPEEVNRYIAAFQRRTLPVFATRDWHPPDHCAVTA